MRNKLIPFLLIGAAAGALISLIDKNTRRDVGQKGKELGYYATHPKEVQEKFNAKRQEPSKFDAIKDEVMYWKDTLDDIRKNNPELEKQLMDAKDTLVQSFKDKKNN